MAELDRASFRYASCYCEENVWQLAREERIEHAKGRVVFISNAKRCCPMWSQRAASSPEQPALWDYHVIYLARRTDERWWVYDLDSTLAFPVGAELYLQSTFPRLERLEAELRPSFRVVAREEFLRTFATDRSHMREGDLWRAPPPPWPLIRTEASTMNLFDFVDMEKAFVGEVLTLEMFRARFLQASIGAIPR
jgi:hypothetical protein